MNGLVYIIVPVYNVEKYIKRCLDSIFNQTYKNTFVIAINDGSTDDSLIILNDYKKKYKNIKIIDKPNGGLSSARNAGLDAINDYGSNTYITFVDSDDYVSLDYIETLMTIMKNNNCDIVCSEPIKAFEDKDSANCSTVNSNHTEDNKYSKDALFELLRGKVGSYAPSKIYKSFCWNNIRFDEKVVFLEDKDLMHVVFSLSRLITLTTYRGYYYIMRDNSLCGTALTNQKIVSAIGAYFSPYIFQYPYDEKTNSILAKTAKNEFVIFFLRYITKYDDKDLCCGKDSLEPYKRRITRSVLLKTKPKKFLDIIRIFLYFISPSSYCKIWKIMSYKT